MTNATSGAQTDHRIGFRPLTEEVSGRSLTVEGRLPDWLSGSLVRVTPAGLEPMGVPVRHWFDGMAMLNAFSFEDGGVTYGNRYLDTDARREVEGNLPRMYAGFATDPCRSIFKRVATTFSPPPGDNTNVNLVRLGDEYLAMTESPAPILFDPRTLETKGHGVSAPGQMTTAHPHADLSRNLLLNHAVAMGARSSYRVFSRGPGEDPRIIGEVPVKEPGYMHSFALTERYVILVEFPLLVNPLDLAVRRKSFIESFRWLPERGTRFLVVEREGGRLVREARTDAFFAFHHVNAFEREGELILDICAYADPTIIDSLYLEPLRDGGQVPRSTLCRYRVSLDRDQITRVEISPEPIELPRIAYGRRNGLPYRFTYGAGFRTEASRWFDQLVKVDAEDGGVLTWSEEGCYPGEPVFASAPETDDEDAGALLSVVLDSRRGCSFLLVLDAATMGEVARARAPHAITFGFHGQYFR